MVPIVVLTLMGGWALVGTVDKLLEAGAEVIRARRLQKWSEENAEAVFVPAKKPQVFYSPLDAALSTEEEGQELYDELRPQFPKAWEERLFVEARMRGRPVQGERRESLPPQPENPDGSNNAAFEE